LTDPSARLAAALADRYRVERELGQGGMATAYLAHDLRYDRRVAITALRDRLDEMKIPPAPTRRSGRCTM